MIVSCPSLSDCPSAISKEYHHSSREAALASFDARRAAALFNLKSGNVDEAFDKALEKAIDGGFIRSSRNYPQHWDAQLAILLTPTAMSYIADKVSTAASDHRKNRYARTLAWIATQKAASEEIEIKRAFKNYIEPLLRTRGALSRVLDTLYTLPPIEEVVSVAGSLWVYRDSAFHTRAKLIMWSEPFEVSGYTPKNEYTCIEVSHEGILSQMGIHESELPRGVLAFDIETDTERGYGLRPTKTQITEIVVSSHDKSWVLAGDERFVLECFAKLLNEQEEHVVLAGWNNWSFDNIVLQTRAEYHETAGWNGMLEPARNATVFEPVGLSFEGQSFLWTTPQGHILHDIDIFQEKAIWDQSRGDRYTVGLKPLMTALGCTPVVVDRQRLHEYSEEERRQYVLSDGISTLRALTEVRRLQELNDNYMDAAL